LANTTYDARMFTHIFTHTYLFLKSEKVLL